MLSGARPQGRTRRGSKRPAVNGLHRGLRGGPKAQQATAEGHGVAVIAHAGKTFAHGGDRTVRRDLGASARVKLDRQLAYDLDSRKCSNVKVFRVEVEPGVMSVCVPHAA